MGKLILGHEIQEVNPGDENYPECFLNTPSNFTKIQTIYVLGDLSNLNVYWKKCISIVGSRACTQYGIQTAGSLALDLANKGYNIASGGAFGIDSAAHKGSLLANRAGGILGKTIAFNAGGLENLYPISNFGMFEQILQQGGLIISEQPPEETNRTFHFLERNRLIAAYSNATVVVEAAWRSGALSTVGHANSLMRPVGGVPGLITTSASSGVHELIRNQKATLITSADDILELVEPIGSTLFDTELDDEANVILTSLTKSHYISIEKIAAKTGLPIEIVIAKLGRLDLSGFAGTDGSGWRKL